MSQIKKNQRNANKANKATQELLKKAAPHLKTLKQSIEKTKYLWLTAQTMIGNLQNMDKDEAAQIISKNLMVSTDIMLTVLDRLKNDTSWQKESNKLFCLFGESLKEAILIITETIVKTAPPATEAFIKALKTLVPILNAAIIASWGTLKEMAFTTCPPCAAIYNLVETGGKLITQFGLLMSRAGDSAASVSELGSAGLEVFTQKTPAIEKIINNFGQILEHLANLTEVMANATDIKGKIPRIPDGPHVPTISSSSIKPMKGGRRTRKYHRGGSSPTFNDVLSAWLKVGFAPFDILNLQQEANEQHKQLQKNIKWLQQHVPPENIKDVEEAIVITKQFMNKPKKEIKEIKEIKGTKEMKGIKEIKEMKEIKGTKETKEIKGTKGGKRKKRRRNKKTKKTTLKKQHRRARTRKK